ncbi:hypothetical protein [Nocardia sp. NRRL S-836]|uniref:hypothetical protein n=1 Tax=Nocardia sp. NRRL S-836 TaxID=1519492 RepID=UPI0006AF7E05|nr:hypothetical protein [Nocardia sp. NRRL S-836]KOV84002.1 hypothetical protein ADL03_18435 [Nocardia sp. NRRL S-836]
MRDNHVEITGPVLGSNIGTSGHARAGDVHIGHARDVAAVLRLLDALREELGETQAAASTVEAVDDLRAEARKHKPSRDVTAHLMDKLAGRGLGEQMEDLAKAFDALY